MAIATIENILRQEISRLRAEGHEYQMIAEAANESLAAENERLKTVLAQVGVVLDLHGIKDTAAEVAKVLGRPDPAGVRSDA